MLGQFFGSRKGVGAPSPTTTVDSATEESHTRHLLYPDANTLYHPEGQPYPLHGASLSLGSGHDGPLPEIDLEFPRDCRIIIAQDEFMSMPKAILFDSKPGPPQAASPPAPHTRSRVFSGSGSSSTAGPTFGGMHARRSSLVTESTPRSPTVAAFTRTRARGNSISSMPNIDEHAQAQAQAHAQAKANESIDVVRTCLDCMFGNTTMSYRGNSNKLHIVPLDPRPSETVPAPQGLQDAAGSLGKSDGFRRRSHLVNSYTPGNLPADLPRTTSDVSILKEPRRRTIFITRMFSVAVPDEEYDSSQERTPTPQSSLGKGNAFPFPRAGTKPGAPKFTQPPHARKTPMYAITIILHLPVTPQSSMMRPPSRTGHQGRGGAGLASTSAPGNDSLGSSFDSDQRAGWAHIFGDSPLSNSISSDVDDRVDVIGQHWDVITRTLTSLQQVVQARILDHFKVEDNIPQVVQLPRNQPARYSNKELPLQLPRRRTKLQPNALAFDHTVREAVELAGTRVVSGMRIPRVMTGQGKWGVWREEARWLGRWAGGRDENTFFYNLLTAFLGNHTEWLNLLGPKWHRKRHREQQRSNAGENLTIASRTVIVSPDKMAARRLIFLLAAFLPPNTSTAYDGASPIRPSTSASLRGYSQSPPTNSGMPPSRKHSLRRQINRRPRGKPSLTNMRLHPGVAGSPNLPTLESAIGHPEPTVDILVLPEARRHARRSSAHSINANLMLPSMSDSVVTKSSMASISTVTPQNAVPVAHFTLPRSKTCGQPLEDRPTSSDSLASANLMQTLRRGSIGHASIQSGDSGSTSRWSSFSSFWSGGRRQSSSEKLDFLQTTDDGLGMSNGASRSSERPRSRLELMVQELSMNQELFEESVDLFDPSASNMDTAADGSPETYPFSGSSGVPASAARPIPQGPKQFDCNLKLSVNEKDGVIDVDIPLPSFGSPLQSPLFGGDTSASSQQGSSYGETSIFSMPRSEPDQPVNAAGWLKQFHPDFAVQAIKPYADLTRDIKRAMSAEPTPITSVATPSLEHGPVERWIDVCSAVVADTRSFSIKRIRLRRRVKLVPTPTYQQPGFTPGAGGIPGRSQYGNPYAVGTNTGPLMTEVNLEEKFSEESILEHDVTLSEAIDRVISQSGQTSRAHSTNSSRSSSRRGRRDTRGSDVGQKHAAEVPHTDCKAVLFDALEAVVKIVTAERNAKDDVIKDEVDSERTTTRGRELMGKIGVDSALKEGVRRWISEVE